MRKAIGYAGEAVRLLCKHPSLALVALAMGVLGAADMRVGAYLKSEHTAYGRDSRAWRAKRRRELSNDPRMKALHARIARMMRLTPYLGWTAVVTPPQPPRVNLSGSVQLASALTYRPGQGTTSGDHSPYYSHDAAALPVVAFLPWLIGALTTGSFLWVMWQTVRRDRVPWREWLVPGWRVWLRLGIFTSAVGAAPLTPYGLAMLPGRWYAVVLAMAYAWAMVSFLLVLAPFAIVAGRTGIMQAVRVSARLVATNVVTALLLVLGASVLAWLAGRFTPLYQTLYRDLRTMTQTADFTSWQRSLAGLPWDIALGGVASVIAAWYSAAMLIWYVDLTRPATPESPALC